MTDEEKKDQQPDAEKTVEKEKVSEGSSQARQKAWGGFMKGLKEFGSAAFEKAEELGKIASDKAEELTRSGKIHLDIHQLKRNLTKELAALGREVYTLQNDGKLADLESSEVFQNALKEIKSMEDQIAAKEEEIKAIQAEEAKSAE